MIRSVCVSLLVVGALSCVVMVACQPGGSGTGMSYISSDGKPMVKVGDTVITREQVEAKQQSHRFGPQRTGKVIDDLVNSRLLYLAAVRDNIDQDPKVKVRLQEQIEKILGQIYLNRAVASLGKTDKELSQYYEAHKEDFLLPKRASISHIQTPSMDQGQKILKDVLANTISFENAAKESSVDKNTAANGGRLGFVTENNAIPLIGVNDKINKAIFSARTGAIVGPFESRHGFHLIKILSMDDNKYEEFERVKRRIVDTLAISDQEVQDYYNEMKEKRFKRKAFVKVKHIQFESRKQADKALKSLKKGTSFDSLVKKYSKDKLSLEKGGDLGLVYSDGYIPRIGMDKTLLTALFALEAGETSTVLKSKNGHHIFMVYEKSPEKYHDLDKVRKSIVNILAGQKRIEKRKSLMQELESQFKIVKLFDENENVTQKSKPANPAQATGE